MYLKSMSTSYYVNAEGVSVRRPQHQLPLSVKLALVAEGGGQRGIFTSGVLDHFLQQRFNPFDVLVGTSAGAQNLSSYILQQQGFARKAITQLTTQDAFFQPRAALAGEGGLNLDWYFEQMKSAEYQLPLYDLSDKLSRQDFFIIASDKNRLETVVLNPDSTNLVKYLKSSSSIPYFYQPDDAPNETLVDGGLTAPIPIQQALDMDANIIVVVRTVPSSGERDSLWNWRKKIATTVRDKLERSFREKKPAYNELLDLMNHHERSYHENLMLIDNPPEGVIVIEIAPTEKLASRIVGSSEKSLDDDYDLGWQTAEQFLNNFRHWMDDRPAEGHSRPEEIPQEV